MKKNEVPQDGGVYAPHNLMQYAVDADGKYIMTPSTGWEVTNTSNGLSLEEIAREVERAADSVRANKVSPLAYFMAKNQMTCALLSQYAGIAKWRVKRHLRPEVFTRLKPKITKRYADLFGVSPAELYNPLGTTCPQE